MIIAIDYTETLDRNEVRSREQEEELLNHLKEIAKTKSTVIVFTNKRPSPYDY